MRLLHFLRYRDSPLYATPIAVLFFLSGSSSLIYQIVWMRQLSLFFGSDVYSAAIILSCFMGGLSLGSVVVARVADRIRRPLVWYGVFEIAIGLCALAYNGVLHTFLPLHQFIYRQWFESAPWRYQLFRVTVAAAMLLVPTSLMGATLPLIVKRFVRRHAQLGALSGFFYAVNTAGALAGTLGVSFVLLPGLGVRQTTLVAVALNLASGIVALTIALRQGPHGAADVAEPVSRPPGQSDRQGRTVLICIGVSGLAALALEVVWTRVLIQSFSATVYSFSIMLSCFLFGICYGSQKASSAVDAADHPLRLLGFLELALAVAVSIVAILSPMVPTMCGRALWTLTALTRGAFGRSSVIAEFMVSGILIAVPTILMGATFPAAVRAHTTAVSQPAESTGRVYASNTLGGVVGALAGGMVLIPAFGSKNSLAVIAIVFLANALWVIWKSAGPPELTGLRVVLPAACCVACALGTCALPARVVTNFNLQQNTRPQVIYHGEGIAHSIDIVRSDQNDVIMMVDGNIEADSSYVQRRHFVLKGHLPLLLHPSPREVAIIGLGLGITLNATAHHPGLRTLQVIELTPEMLDAQRHLDNITGGVLRDPRVRVRIDDGRNFLGMTDRTFDMITADPIHPRISGVGYLYTTEYYESIKLRLRPHGIVCQWMPMYQLSRASFDVAFRTFAAVFPNASFWYVRGHGLFVATEAPFRVDYATLVERFRDPQVHRDLASIHIDSPSALLTHMMLGPAEMADYLARSEMRQMNTDDNAYLEYRTPFEFLSPTKDILTALLQTARLDDRIVVNVPDTARSELHRMWDARKADILPELDRVALASPSQ